MFNKRLQAFDSDSLKSLFLNAFQVSIAQYRLEVSLRSPSFITANTHSRNKMRKMMVNRAISSRLSIPMNSLLKFLAKIYNTLHLSMKSIKN